MQELQPIPGLAGRLFGSGGAAAAAIGLLRRHGGSSAAEVRCPRCDSPDTKFCYYNNYNLAQPRHFCRACRRYWTKGGHLRNVPVGGGCRKPRPRRPAAAAADGRGKDGVHRDGKAPRSGFAGAASSSSPTAAGDADAPVSGAFSVVTEPSVPRSGGVAEASAETGSFAAGDTRALLVPPPAPMFADQASVFASLFAPPRPLSAFGSSAQPQPEQAEERVAASLLAAEQPPPSCTAAFTDTAPFAAGSDGALSAGPSDWPTAGIFELAGGNAGDASLPEHWNHGSWTDPDPAVYLP
ncbi:hypothetical protein SEVIR_4G192500v4 [Setaria viridis]|uniref:Dof zinc finger protein n=1 Tax=Setaria viridis TaxID=4556 RepID=A0A4V6D874_SETVI|nr:dof zinc finger protein 4-like [Setaria viridis]TKW20976.1 hypothetical protein SEVIR_4G192500v2 [Setaria viridis]